MSAEERGGDDSGVAATALVGAASTKRDSVLGADKFGEGCTDISVVEATWGGCDVTLAKVATVTEGTTCAKRGNGATAGEAPIVACSSEFSVTTDGAMGHDMSGACVGVRNGADAGNKCGKMAELEATPEVVKAVSELEAANGSDLGSFGTRIGGGVTGVTESTPSLSSCLPLRNPHALQSFDPATPPES